MHKSHVCLFVCKAKHMFTRAHTHTRAQASSPASMLHDAVSTEGCL